GALAHSLGAPEHRLRKAINQGLGFRNFNAYLNSFRIAETLAALADPEQAEVPILTLALDAGFNSLGPFNRAFRAATDMTPTAYRRQALSAGDAPPSSGSAGRIPNSA
ncbi:MAG: helix-turn-helix domain-containing protein, partial [Phenylobacterium sp.]|uniref:helix-turn-helix domain-containing protein n=1 Tax=Phenylobacterium sp. TaxID=1871053 RepID=UPI003BB54AD8